jgi:hypothetical protein
LIIINSNSEKSQPTTCPLAKPVLITFGTKQQINHWLRYFKWLAKNIDLNQIGPPEGRASPLQVSTKGVGMQATNTVRSADQNRALSLSTVAFTACFAVWTIFSIIGVAIKAELGLNEFEFGLLVATPILTGSLTRLFLGVWTEKFGGRVVFPLQMLLAALATWLLTFAHTYPMYLVAALGVGLAGGSFIIGVAYVSRWYPAGKQGTALGIFGAGNVGAAVTKFVAPL